MKKFVILSVLMLAGCGVDDKSASLKDVSDKLDRTWTKAVDDTRNEYDRTENRVDDTLVKANHDVLNEEATTTGRVKDTLAETNKDVVEEEHKFNDKFKKSTKKANMDTISEGDKLTDKIVGSDDKTVDQQGDQLRDHEVRISLLEKLGSLHSSLLDSVFAMLNIETKTREAADKGLAQQIADAISKSIDDVEALRKSLQDQIDVLKARTSDLEESTDDLNVRVSALEVAMGDVDSVQEAIDGAVASLADKALASCTLTLTDTSVEFQDYTSRNTTLIPYCRKSGNPDNYSNVSYHHGVPRCPSSWTLRFETRHSGDDAVANSLIVKVPSLSCTTVSESEAVVD